MIILLKVPQFTPQAESTLIKMPSTRPSSPFSGQPLRAKDLIPIGLILESSGSNSNSTVKYLCPVSRLNIYQYNTIELYCLS